MSTTRLERVDDGSKRGVIELAVPSVPDIDLDAIVAVRFDFDRVPPQGVAAQLVLGGGEFLAVEGEWLDVDTWVLNLPRDSGGLTLRIRWEPRIEVVRVVAVGIGDLDATRIELTSLDPEDSLAEKDLFAERSSPLDGLGNGILPGDREVAHQTEAEARARQFNLALAGVTDISVHDAEPAESPALLRARSLFMALEAVTLELERTPASEAQDALPAMLSSLGMESRGKFIASARPHMESVRGFLLSRIRRRASARPSRTKPRPYGIRRYLSLQRRARGGAASGVRSESSEAQVIESLGGVSELLLRLFGFAEWELIADTPSVSGDFRLSHDPGDSGLAKAYMVSEELRMAIYRFSDSSLRVKGHRRGQNNATPDSSAYFGFGELALVLGSSNLVNGEQKRAWRALFEVFVHAAEIFASVFAQRVAPKSRTMEETRRLFEREGLHPWTGDEIQSLHRRDLGLRLVQDRRVWDRLEERWNRIIQIVLFDEATQEIRNRTT